MLLYVGGINNINRELYEACLLYTSILDSLRQWRCRFSEELTEVEIRPGDYHFSEKLDADQLKDGWMSFGACETWGGRDRHFWFRTKVVIRKEWAGKEVRVTLNTGADDIWNTDNPQIMAYKNGILSGTMDMNHQDLILAEDCLLYTSRCV